MTRMLGSGLRYCTQHNVTLRHFSNTRKREQYRRQTRVLNDETAGASGSFECQGHSAMLITQQYAKWQSGNGGLVNGVGYGMVSTWVPLAQIETASIGDDSGGSRSKNDP
eukprot:scaffold63462_cov71-Attheya_sp.AAC.5